MKQRRICARFLLPALIAALFVLVALPLQVRADEIRGTVETVSPDGEVRVSLPEGATAAVGDTVRIEADLPGIGAVPIRTRWQVREVGAGYVLAAPRGTPSGAPQPGFAAVIESAAKPEPKTATDAKTETEPAEKAAEADQHSVPTEVPTSTVSRPEKTPEPPENDCDRLVGQGLYLETTKYDVVLREHGSFRDLFGQIVPKDLDEDDKPYEDTRRYMEKAMGEWRRSIAGSRLVPIEIQKVNSACRSAIAEFPEVDRFRIALARAYAEAGRLTEAVAMYRKLLKTGRADVMNDLGVLHADGRGLPRDNEEARRLLRAAAQKGSPAAHLNMSHITMGRYGGTQDVAESKRLMQEAARMGDTFATYVAIQVVNNIFEPEEREPAVIRYLCALARTEPVFATMNISVSGDAAVDLGASAKAEVARCILDSLSEATQSTRAVTALFLVDVLRKSKIGAALAMRSVEMVCNAAESGSIMAQVLLSQGVSDPDGGKYAMRARDCLTAAADKGSVLAMLLFAEHYEDRAKKEGTGGLQALAWYERAASHESVTAIAKLAAAYRDGKGVPRDDKKALRLYRKAYDLLAIWSEDDRRRISRQLEALEVRQVQECDRLAAHSHDSDAVAPGVSYKKLDAPAVIKACKRARDAYPGILRFQVQLARGLHKAGQHGDAMDAWREAAILGNAQAMAYLGIMYKTGDTVKKDLAAALYWLEKAAEKDNVPGMVFAAKMYNDGQGIARSPAMALKWYGKAAAKGNGDAMVNLALMYDAGNGIKQDPAKAADLLLRAHRKDFDDARDLLMKNAASLSRRTRMEIQKRLRDAGHYTGAIDGRFGSGTKRAIEAMRKS